ncbi:MAG: type II secretion system F family protein [Betaproteobacteria bacterium]|nr:type II secretion system F family protein [Betaproteobacteria bacterium]MDH4293313.1 type II secretion system F family protein [Betaproteobacteria bacterium]MDH5342912.1 type II secretion system F family protein [Betaproteobacteria bacterium]
MPSFEYRAIDKTGRQARGGLDAVNEIDLELRLRRMGLDLIACKPVDRQTSSTLAAGGAITRQDLVNFCFDMEQMVRSGIPILDGLRDMRDTIDSPRFREVLTIMTEDMEAGNVLSQCMASHADVFDRVFINLIRAGEQSGQLPEVFKNLADTIRWQDELISQTKRLLMYPTLTLVVVLAVMGALLVFLVPQIAQLFKSMGMALPMQTRALLAVSEFTKDFWLPIVLLPIIAIVTVVVVVRRSDQAAYLWDYAKLRIPVIGPILQKIILSRFANTFGLMYRSGITVLDAIRISEDVVGNRVVADGLNRAVQQVSGGAGLTETFQNLGLFPPLVIRMLRVGESTGALDVALANVTYFYNRDVKDSVDKGMKMLGPALTLVLGGLIAFVIWAVLGPVYDILGKLKF